MGTDSFHQTKLLNSPLNLTLNTVMDGALTDSMGSLFQCLTSLTVKNFYLISNLNFPSFSFNSLLLVLSVQFLMKSPSPSENFFINFSCVISQTKLGGFQDSCKKKEEQLSYQKVNRNFLCQKAKKFERNSLYVKFLLVDCWKPVHHALFNSCGPFNLIKVYVVCQIINRLGQRRVSY